MAWALEYLFAYHSKLQNCKKLMIFESGIDFQTFGEADDLFVCQYTVMGGVAQQS